MKTLEQAIPTRKIIDVAEARYAIVSSVNLREEELKSESSLSYDLDIKYIGGGGYEKWDKSNFRINGINTFTKIDEVYLKVAQPLNKLDFFYENGKITDLVNYKPILKEWEVVKENLINEFYGVVINDIIVKTTENLNNLDKLKSMLSQDLVLQHLHFSTELNDTLIYYKSSQNKRSYLGIIADIPLPYFEQKTFSESANGFQLNTSSELDREAVDLERLTKYFEFKVDEFKLENLNSSIQSKITIDPKNLWIEDAWIQHDIRVENSNYKKTITLTIKRL